MKRVMIFRPNAISKDDRAMLESNDIIVIELLRPSDVVTIHPVDQVTGNDICLAALSALSKYGGSNAHLEFVSNLNKRLLDAAYTVAQFKKINPAPSGNDGR